MELDVIEATIIPEYPGSYIATASIINQDETIGTISALGYSEDQAMSTITSLLKTIGFRGMLQGYVLDSSAVKYTGYINVPEMNNNYG